MDLQMSNGNSFNGNSSYGAAGSYPEPWWFRVMLPIQPDR
jgi:hypothetical protein